MKAFKRVLSLLLVASVSLANASQVIELNQFRGEVVIPADGVFTVTTGDRSGGIAQKDFDNLKRVIESAATPVSLTLIGKGELPNGCFAQIKNLKSIDISAYSVIPDNFIPRGSIERVVLSHNVTKISSNAFFNCPNLTTIEFAGEPRTATSLVLGGSAFASNPGLIDVDMSYATELLGNTFSECVNLKSVNLSSVKELGQQIFGSSNKLERIDLSAAGVIRLLTDENMVMQGFYMRAERACTLILNKDKFGKGKGKPRVSKEGNEWLTRDANGTPLKWFAIESK